MDSLLGPTLGFPRGLAWQKNKKSHRTAGADASKKGGHARKTQRQEAQIAQGKFAQLTQLCPAGAKRTHVPRPRALRCS